MTERRAEVSLFSPCLTSTNARYSICSVHIRPMEAAAGGKPVVVGEDGKIIPPPPEKRFVFLLLLPTFC